MKKALAVAALSVLALTACSEQPQTQPVALESVPAFNTLIHISLHPVEAPVTAQSAPVAQEPAPVIAYPVAVAQPAPVAVYVPAPVTTYQVVVPAPVQTPAPAVVPAPVVTPVVVATPTPTPAPAVTPAPVPSPAPCVGKRCGEPASGTVTSPICTTDNPMEACWHHIVVIPTPVPETKEDHK